MFGVRAPEDLRRLALVLILFLVHIRLPAAAEGAVAMVAIVFDAICRKGVLDNSAVVFIRQRFFIVGTVHPVEGKVAAEYNGSTVGRNAGPAGFVFGLLKVL